MASIALAILYGNYSRAMSPISPGGEYPGFRPVAVLLVRRLRRMGAGDRGSRLSAGWLALLGVVHVYETPLSVLFAVNLSLDAMGRDRRAVLAQCGMKIPVKL